MGQVSAGNYFPAVIATLSPFMIWISFSPVGWTSYLETRKVISSLDTSFGVPRWCGANLLSLVLLKKKQTKTTGKKTPTPTLTKYFLQPGCPSVRRARGAVLLSALVPSGGPGHAPLPSGPAQKSGALVTWQL